MKGVKTKRFAIGFGPVNGPPPISQILRNRAELQQHWRAPSSSSSTFSKHGVFGRFGPKKSRGFHKHYQLIKLHKIAGSISMFLEIFHFLICRHISVCLFWTFSRHFHKFFKKHAGTVLAGGPQWGRAGGIIRAHMCFFKSNQTKRRGGQILDKLTLFIFWRILQTFPHFPKFTDFHFLNLKNTKPYDAVASPLPTTQSLALCRRRSR